MIDILGSPTELIVAVVTLLALLLVFVAHSYRKKLFALTYKNEIKLHEQESCINLKFEKQIQEIQTNQMLELKELLTRHEIRITELNQQMQLGLKQKELEHEQDLQQKIKQAVKISNNGQRAVIKGKTSEQIAPLLEEFAKNHEISDARFIGAPIDYVAFDGMSKFNGGENEQEITITLIDVKSGNASITKIQRAIKDAIQAGRVRFEEVRLSSLEKILRQNV